jgi:glutamyl-tRNA reductase
MQRLLLLGLNHTTAPLEVREKLAFDAATQKNAIESLRKDFPECEFVLLSTCNRVEFYAAREVHGRPRTDELLVAVASLQSVSPDAVKPHLYEKTDREAVAHLFHVASSLDSMVLGETQILGQVRNAYDAATSLGSTGAMLNPLFQRAIAVGKQVLRETPLGEGRLSVASVAVDYVRQIFDHFGDKTVLSIGAGEMAQLVLRHFAELKPGKMLVTNRTLHRAESLAQEFHCSAVDFEKLTDHLAAADIVISSTGAPEPIITRARMETALKARRYKPIVMLDIALPRDIEAGVGESQSVYLYNIDDLQKVVQHTQNQRRAAIDAATRIVLEHVDDFIASTRARELGPAIERLYAHHHKLAQEELHRTLNKLNHLKEDEKSHVEELARRIVNKLLHDPIKTLRSADNSHGPSAQYLHALEKLFKLEDHSPEERKDE